MYIFINLLKHSSFTHASGCKTERILNFAYRAQLCVLYDSQKNSEYFPEQH